MEKRGPRLVEVLVAQGQIAAEVVKSHLEGEGIPVLLKYESAGPIFGITVDGLGKVRIMVPEELAEEAKRIIEPQVFDKSSE